MSDDKKIQQLFLAEPITGDKAVQLAANKDGPDPRLNLPERDTREPLVIYRVKAQQAIKLGLTSDQTLAFGFTLETVYRRGFDMLAEELANGWQGDCLDRILLPEGGLILGKFYTAHAVNLSRDPETGQVEDWDTQLVEYTGVVPEQEGGE